MLSSVMGSAIVMTNMIFFSWIKVSHLRNLVIIFILTAFFLKNLLTRN